MFKDRRIKEPLHSGMSSETKSVYHERRQKTQWLREWL